MRTYRATSYAMGSAVESKEFRAASPEAAVERASRLGLPARGSGEGGKRIAVIGVKRLG